MVFENIGLDPHFLHADLYAELALTRVADPDTRPFADYRVKAQKKAAETEHEWAVQSNPAHVRCEKCGLTVVVPPGGSAQERAEKLGYAECRKYPYA
jgi:hypothetical protein